MCVSYNSAQKWVFLRNLWRLLSNLLGISKKILCHVLSCMKLTDETCVRWEVLVLIRIQRHNLPQYKNLDRVWGKKPVWLRKKQINKAGKRNSPAFDLVICFTLFPLGVLHLADTQLCANNQLSLQPLLSLCHSFCQLNRVFFSKKELKNGNKYCGVYEIRVFQNRNIFEIRQNILERKE